MKRFIRYLYEYGQGRKLRNVGFVKVEQGSDDCVLHIHGKGLHLQGNRSLRLYLIYAEEEKCVGIWQGDVERVNPAINYRMYYTREDTGTPELFDRISGMVLLGDDGRVFAAIWEEPGPDVEHMRIWEPEMKKEEPEVTEPEETVPEEAGPGSGPEMDVPEPEEGTEEYLEEPAEEAGEEDGQVRAEEKLERGFRCTKIRREDLASLPRCEWKLSNNSFLLHGYYNYHHLMFLDDGEWLRLGVPGIYHVKEAAAAAAFGFPEFIRKQDLEEPFGGGEEEEEDFGYWCRCVKRQKGGRSRDGYYH